MTQCCWQTNLKRMKKMRSKNVNKEFEDEFEYCLEFNDEWEWKPICLVFE